MDLQSTNNIASNLYTKKPTESVAVVDVYKDKASGIINSIQDVFNTLGFGGDLLGLIKGGKSLSQAFPIINDVKGVINKQNMMDRVFASTDLLRTVSGNAFSNDLLSSIDKAYVEYGDFYSKAKDVARIVDTTDFKNLNSVGNLVNRLSGEAGTLFEDQDGLSALVCGVVEEATRYGIPNSWESISRTITNSDILAKAGNQLIPFGISTGDFKLIGDITNSVVAGDISKQFPNLISSAAKNFGLNLDGLIMTAQEIGLTGNQSFFTLLNTIDPKWTIYERDGKEVFDATTIVSGSNTFKNTIGSVVGGELVASVHAVKDLKSTDVETSLSNEFRYRSVPNTKYRFDDIIDSYMYSNDDVRRYETTDSITWVNEASSLSSII